jgi:hypothetical protein
MLHLYYLSCHHTMQVKIDPSLEYARLEEGDEGVVNPQCPIQLLDFVGTYLLLSIL